MSIIGQSCWDKRVQNLFGCISDKYDIGNTLISFGLHIKWKRAMLTRSGKLVKGARILDAATGTGDIAILAKKLVPDSTIMGVDFSSKMLDKAKKRANKILVNNRATDNSDITFFEADVRSLSMFDNAYFDLYTIGFGLRNIEDKKLALSEMRRVLKVDGVLSILELSKPMPIAVKPFAWLYLWCVMPFFSLCFSGSQKNYLWLAQSLNDYPDYDSLKLELENSGFTDVARVFFGLGVVSLISARAI